MTDTTDNKKYMFATFSRSFIENKPKNGGINLTSSICFVKCSELELENLVSDSEEELFIFIVSSEEPNFLNGEVSTKKLGNNVSCMYTHLFSLFDVEFTDIGTIKSIKAKKDLLSMILETEYSSSSLKVSETYSSWSNVLSNSLFIFEGVNYTSLQALSKLYGFNISGGGKRQHLTPVDFKLSLYLSKLGFTSKDVYTGLSKISKLKDKENTPDSLTTNTLETHISSTFLNNETLIKSIIKQKIEIQIKSKTKEIEILDKSTLNVKNSINGLEVSLSLFLTKKEDKKKTKNATTSINFKKVSRTHLQIAKFKDLLRENQHKTDKINLELNQLKTNLNDISKLTDIELKKCYFEKYHFMKNPHKLFLLKNLLTSKRVKQIRKKQKYLSLPSA